MIIIPIGLKEANAYVENHHRHNKPTVGHKFSIGVKNGDVLVGVCICGKPIARKLDDGKTLEVRRVCTDGTPNACSILYGAAARIAREMGYERIITYTLQSEPGTSLKASGWICMGEAGGVSWNTPSRPRDEYQITLFGIERKYSAEKKYRWERLFNA
jgi:hypothetical protein